MSKQLLETTITLDRISTGETDEAALQGVADDMGISISLLIHSLLNLLAGNDAIRLVVICIILSRCDGRRHPNFLPHQLAELATSIPGRHDCQ